MHFHPSRPSRNQPKPSAISQSLSLRPSVLKPSAMSLEKPRRATRGASVAAEASPRGTSRLLPAPRRPHPHACVTNFTSGRRRRPRCRLPAGGHLVTLCSRLRFMPPPRVLCQRSGFSLINTRNFLSTKFPSERTLANRREDRTRVHSILSSLPVSNSEILIEKFLRFSPPARARSLEVICRLRGSGVTGRLEGGEGRPERMGNRADDGKGGGGERGRR